MDYFEDRAMTLAYDLVVTREHMYTADWLLEQWLKEAEAGFTHQGLIDHLVKRSRELVAE